MAAWYWNCTVHTAWRSAGVPDHALDLVTKGELDSARVSSRT